MTEAKIGDTGTLEQLGVKAGDVVLSVSNRMERWQGLELTINEQGYAGCETVKWFTPDLDEEYGRTYKLISRATPQPTIFADMTDAEQGALLLAKHRGDVIQMLIGSTWVNQFGEVHGNVAYRVKPKPVVEEDALILSLDDAGLFDTHKLTYNRVDGEIDCASVVLVKL